MARVSPPAPVWLGKRLYRPMGMPSGAILTGGTRCQVSVGVVFEHRIHGSVPAAVIERQHFLGQRRCRGLWSPRAAPEVASRHCLPNSGRPGQSDRAGRCRAPRGRCRAANGRSSVRSNPHHAAWYRGSHSPRGGSSRGPAQALRRALPRHRAARPRKRAGRRSAAPRPAIGAAHFDETASAAHRETSVPRWLVQSPIVGNGWSSSPLSAPFMKLAEGGTWCGFHGKRPSRSTKYIGTSERPFDIVHEAEIIGVERMAVVPERWLSGIARQMSATPGNEARWACLRGRARRPNSVGGQRFANFMPKLHLGAACRLSEE